MDQEQTGTTLRDSLTSAFDEAEKPATPPEVTDAPITESPPETTEQKAGRLAGRPRDELGRVLPGKAVKPEPTGEPVAEAAPRPARPSSWKKDYEAHWEKLDPEVAKYINQREQEWKVHGEAALRPEIDRARPILEAIEPFRASLQQHGVSEQTWIKNLGTAHQTLALGTPQDKLAMFQKLAADYQIPAQLAVQDQNGQWQLLGQQPQPQPQQQPPDVRKLVQEALQEYFTQQEIQKFSTNKEKYPHFSEVIGSMSGLLQSGLAENLNDAYEAALRLPQHAAIYQAMQTQQSEAEALRKREEAARTVRTAKANVISSKPATPSGTVQTAGKGTPRAHLENAFEEHATGRV